MSATGTPPAPRRLVMLVHAYYPLAEPRVEREAHAARDVGMDVEVVAMRQPGEPRRETVDGVRVQRLPLRHVRGASFARIVVEYVSFTLLALAVMARHALRSSAPEVVQVHTPPDFLVAAALPLKLRGARVVLDVHDLSPHIYEARFEGRRVARVVVRALRAVQGAACAFADRVVTVHEPYRRELVDGGVPAEKLAVVMNSPDQRLIAGALTEPAAAVDGRPFTLAYHGTITHWYGVDLLVRALAELRAELPDARALVLGDGDAVPDVLTLASELGVADRVDVSGTYLPIAETLRRVATASCGVIPNRPSTLNRFALSSKLFEYVELGVPVVVARLATLAAHFGPDEVTFFEPGDPDSLADAIRRVEGDPDAARAKAARAKRRAEAYSWPENASRYTALLASLAGH